MKKGRITVVGLGLLGGSLLQALRDRKWSGTLQGVSSPQTVSEALQLGLIDRGWNYDQIDLWKSESDLLFLSTPIDRIAQLLQELHDFPAQFPPNALITDVGSTKGMLSALGEELFPLQGDQPLFVGGHPMAGSEKRGLSARDGTLFESALWLLCPPPGVSPERMAPLIELVETVGARRLELTPEAHDCAVTWVSHLPQALSSAIATTVSRNAPEAVAVAGQGFRDMTRLADSPFSIWKSIFGSNTPRLLEALEATEKVIAEMKQGLQEKTLQGVAKIFEEGTLLRGSLAPRGKGFSTTLVDLIVHVDDRPGSLLTIVKPLTLAQIDIRDLELLKVRDGVGGTFRLSFRSTQEAQRAAEILRNEGLEARLPS